MKVIYAQEDISKPKLLPIGYSVFLAGPTPRIDTPIPSWRPDMLAKLRKLDKTYIREVLIPEPRDGIWTKNYLNQVDWEEEAIAHSDILAFWIPRDVSGGMPGFTTNVEFGWWLDKKEKIVLGYPPGADKCRYLAYKFNKQFPHRKVAASMDEVVEQIKDLCRGWR